MTVWEDRSREEAVGDGGARSADGLAVGVEGETDARRRLSSCTSLRLIQQKPALRINPLSEKNYEPGCNKNKIGRKSSARRSDPARLHSSRHLGWAMVGDAKSRKCKKAILQRIRSGRRGAQPTSAHSSPQPAQATPQVAQAQRRRQRFDLKL